MERILRLSGHPADGRMHVLHGLSGAGKTAVALEVVTRVRAVADRQSAGPRIWWIDARHPAAFAAGMREVARQAGVGDEDVHAGHVVDALWENLGRAPYRWLLIVDGADDLSLLDGPGRLAAGTGWLRPHHCPDGLLLVTTQSGIARLWGTGASLHAVGPLSTEEAAGVLTDHASPAAGTPAQACRLAQRLGRLPLALRMAASYLAEANAMPAPLRHPGTPMTFEAFRAALDRYGVGVDPAAAVESTWQISMDLLHRQGLSHASELVRVLASFSAAPIPYTLLLQPGVLMALPEFGALDSTAVWRSLRELAALQLLELDEIPSRHEGPLCVRLHPLIRDLARRGRQPRAVIALMERVLQLQEVRVPPENPQAWPVWRILAPHALDLADVFQAQDATFSPSERKTCADAGELAARYLQSQGLYGQARKGFEQVLALRTEGDADELDTAATRHNLALVLHDLGELEEAERLYEKVWQTLCHARGPQHSQTLTVRHELGRVLLDRGCLPQAQAHLEAVLAVRDATDGTDSPNALATRHELARVLHRRRRMDEARREYAHLLVLRRRLSGEEHPRTVTVWHNYACVLHDMGLMEQAHLECEQALAAQRTLYGEDHPDTLATGYLFAAILRARSLRGEADAVLSALHERSGRLLGESHPLTKDCAELLARWALQDPSAGPGTGN
ncbi:tetratricopeptide repeat protein [Streptomyces cinnabarinus]|uniref:Tetratricopeptide repeat protein n=1 Tax=Streptomyces cinnabarinus TaxID=67287 RepID=A0ABY7KUF5_9ACTN|nr:tetratricopeptide repeat protein [Streptomyces cinnabarinus]WAZ26601.1 tetratricopeptide repeat protein [Streptomyces cinnabarinus]